MYGLRMTSVPSVRSYKDAVGFYLKCDPWRGNEPDDERPLMGKRYRSYGVRMSGSDVVFRYEHTDVVVWHDDDSYSINTGGYNTPSTCRFAENFMPAGHYLGKETNVLVIKGTAYAFAGHRINVSSDGVPSGEGLGVFSKKRINRKRSKELLIECGYPAYREWHNTMYPMVSDTMRTIWNYKFSDVQNVIGALRCPDMWHNLMVSQLSKPEAVRRFIYEHLGKSFGIYDYEEVNKLEDWTQYDLYEVETRC